MKCSNCGKSDQARMKVCTDCYAAFNDLNKINFLEDWLISHETQIGVPIHDLYAELQAQRERLYSKPQLMQFYTKTSLELALLEAVSKHIPSWEQNAILRPASLKYIREHVQQSIEDLLSKLHIRSIPERSLSEIEILDYVIKAIPDWIDPSSFNARDANALRYYINHQRETELRKLAKQLATHQYILELIPHWMKESQTPTQFTRNLVKQIKSQNQRIAASFPGRPTKVKRPSLLETITYTLDELPVWVDILNISCEDPAVVNIQNYLIAQHQSLLQPSAPIRPARIPSGGSIKAPPIPIPTKPKRKTTPPAPAAPARPPRPRVNLKTLWDKVIQAAVSGALLRGLLYLGAFMIVVSITILVVRFWEIFPSFIQAIFIFSVPTAFYSAGWILRSKLKLPQAGNALTGVGALLVAVDFAAIYQFGGLAVELNLYWLVVSLLCTLIYALTAWRLKGAFFDYIALIGGTNFFVALTRITSLPLEWNAAALAASSTLMVTAATRLWAAGDTWRDTATATRYLPQVLLPLSMAGVLFIPGSPGVGHIIVFILGTISYGTLAWRFPSVILAHASVWSSLGVFGLAFSATTLPAKWFGTATAFLAVPYTLVSRWLGSRLPPEFPPRAKYIFAPRFAGFILGILAAVLGTAALFFDIWAGVAALTLLSITLISWAYLYRRPLFAVLASGLFIAPFSLAIVRFLLDANVRPWLGWLAAAWTILGMLYIGIAVLLRAAKQYAAALFLWIQVLPVLVGFGLFINYFVEAGTWQYYPTLLALAGVLLLYMLSAWIHDLGTIPGLSDYVNQILPGSLKLSVFIWILSLLTPVWIGVAWMGPPLSPQWLGVALAGTGIVYLPIGQLLLRRKEAYRIPLHATALLLGLCGALVALRNQPALMTALYLGVIILSILAFIYRRVEAIGAASLLLILPFQITLDMFAVTDEIHSLAYSLLACFLYIPIGQVLDRAARKYSLPVYIVGYVLSFYALATSLFQLGLASLHAENLPWTALLTPVAISGLYIFSLYRFQNSLFAWASVLTPMLVYGHLLKLIQLPAEYYAAAWAVLACIYLSTARILIRSGIGWLRSLNLPLGACSAALGTVGLALTIPQTMDALLNDPFVAQMPALILAQVIVMLLPILAAILNRIAWPLYIEPWLAFMPVTLFFVGYSSSFFKTPLSSAEFGIVWSCLGIVHLLVAAVLDSQKVRYAHGLYLGGYVLAVISVLSTLSTPPVLGLTLGLLVLICLTSALYDHTQRHKTWREVITFIFGQDTGRLRKLFENTFLWLAAWLFPVWCVILLSQFAATSDFQWLGFSVPALAYIGLGVALTKIKRPYAWPFNWAAHFYTALALLVSIPFTYQILLGEVILIQQMPSIIATIAIQISAVTFYIIWAVTNQERIFAHLASWLVFFPFTLGWVAFSTLDAPRFALPWMMLSTALLIIGIALDRNTIRYAHGPYLAGYLLAIFSLLWSIPDRQTNLIVMAWCLLLAFLSQILVHYQRHTSWNDLIHKLLSHQPETANSLRLVQSTFLSLGVYAFPVWLVLLLNYHEVQLAWRGLALALVAPLYIAAGLYLRSIRTEYTWSLYSAGYLLTAIGVMASFEDLALATWVLILDAVVYAVSGYIFRQSFWLYLSNLLVPIICLLGLSNFDRLGAPWVSGIYMGLTFLYFAIGWWLDRRTEAKEAVAQTLSPFALAFYTPAYLLSAVSLAAASSQIYLAIIIYLAGVVFYALSAWTFRESLFLYPASLLLAVPYYLMMTLFPISTQWLGLGWLPLILSYIFLGRFVFHRKPLDFRGVAWLGHPAVPFYLLAYALSVSMIALSFNDPLALTLAFSAGALLYMGSSALFQRPVWLYPGLLAVHLALLSYFTIGTSGEPSGSSTHSISIPFMGLTWITALIGYAFSRLHPPAQLDLAGKLQFRFGKREYNFGKLPSFGYLVTPSWAQPFFVFTLINLIVWQSVALSSFSTTIIVALGFATLLALFTMLWQDKALAYVAPLLILLAACARLVWAKFHFAEMLAWIAGFGIGFYLIGLILEGLIKLRQPKLSWLAVWLEPLQNIPVTINAIALIGTLPFILSHTLMTTASLAFAGVLYLALAYRGRYLRLGYLAVSMLEVAWVLELLTRQVREPQLYAIPGGLYFTMMGYLEFRRGNRLIAQILEIFGFAILLLTSFIQSLNGAQGFPYFLLLLVEGLLAIWWGVGRQHKIPFFAGLGISVLNVVSQVIVLINVYEVSRWFVILGVGLLLVLLAVLIERRREQLISQTQEWRDTLENWD